MWRESYTKVVERGVQDIFAACGIDFVSRNHAMGGTASAPEIAICSKEIFGTDIDVLLWDAGMLDQKAHWKMLMYFLRAGTLAQQPAVLGFRLDQGRNSGRTKTVQAAEDTGMPAFVLDHEESRKMNGQIPNTMGLSDAEIAEMPPFVRNFRCTYQIENGDPVSSSCFFRSLDQPCMCCSLIHMTKLFSTVSFLSSCRAATLRNGI
jgi:hypothetical protein